MRTVNKNKIKELSAMVVATEEVKYQQRPQLGLTEPSKADDGGQAGP